VGAFKLSSVLISAEKIIAHFIQNLKHQFSDLVQIRFQFPPLELITSNKESLLLYFSRGNKEAETAEFDAEDTEKKKHSMLLPIDLIVTKETQAISMLRSKLQLNKKVFARNCIIKKINSPEAKVFLNEHHLMGYANSAYHIGLFLKDELIGVASFSKGRKMNRLEVHERSYELVRFCSKSGLTVTGGLSKLIAHFVEEKHPGDIMTYIDKQFGEGESYIKCGFKKHSETAPQQFLINKKTFERSNYKGEVFNKKGFYLSENSGNLKLVYTIGK
jgi:hypothetical protein